MKRKLLSSQHIVKSYTFEAKAVNEKENIIEGIFSTPAVDRHDEVVIQEGWKLDDYIKNPVVLWSHDNYQFPLAQMVRIGFENGQLAGAMKFAVDEYDVAKTAFNLMKGKYLRAFSVGFMNNVYEIDNETEIVKLIENVLLEVSVVNVPANQEALAKIKSIDVLKEAPAEEEAKDEEKKNDEAVKTISQSNKDSIRQAIKALTEALNAGEADIKVDKQVEHPGIKSGGSKKIPVTLINKAVRELLFIKKTQ
jgi:HK97 family phage prohead protease